MLHTHLIWLWYAVAALMLVDAVGYTFGAIGPIRRALNPTEPYWQKRLLLNLMLANQGLYLGAATPLVGAVIETQQEDDAVSWRSDGSRCCFPRTCSQIRFPGIAQSTREDRNHLGAGWNAHLRRVSHLSLQTTGSRHSN